MKIKKTISHLMYAIFLLMVGAIIHFSIESIFTRQADTLHQIEILRLSKIADLDKRLQNFYLPLKNRLHKSKNLWENYQKQYGNTTVLSEIRKGVVNQQTYKWQKYMLIVFQPIHIELLSIIREHRDSAIKSKELEEQLDMLDQHIYQYQVIFSQWKDKDVTENFAPINFPKDIERLVDNDIETLKIEKKVLENHKR